MTSYCQEISAVQSSAQLHLFTMLFCSLTPPTMLGTIKSHWLIGMSYLSTIASNGFFSFHLTASLVGHVRETLAFKFDLTRVSDRQLLFRQVRLSGASGMNATPKTEKKCTLSQEHSIVTCPANRFIMVVHYEKRIYSKCII